MDRPDEKQDLASAEQKETSNTEPETLTEEDRTKKAVSDALSVAGRDAQAMDARESKVKDILSKAEKLQADIKADADKRAEQKYQDDLDKAGEDPVARSKVELNRDLRNARAELSDTKSELSKEKEVSTEARKVAAESTKERNAREIASKYEVDSVTLLLTDGSKEAMEALAKRISGKVIPTLKPDSSRISGGGTMPDSAKGKIRAGWDEVHK